MSSPAEPAGLGLDACGLLNLAGAGLTVTEVRSAVGLSLLVVEQVAREALWIEDIVDGELVQLPVDLNDPAFAGLEEIRLSDVELELFVALAQDVDDGEAATLAAAAARNLVVLTDDRKARRVARRLGVPLVGTAELIRAVADTQDMAADQAGAMLRRVKRRARFTPRRDDPEHGWWSAQVVAQ